METPTSGSKRAGRPRKYAPTPKIHDRKKSLFTKTRSPEHSPKSDDSDLGILSPIYLSSDTEESTTDEELPPGYVTRSAPARRKLLHISRRFSDVNKYEMIPRRLSILEESDDDVPCSPVDLSKSLSVPIVQLTPNDAYTGHKDRRNAFKQTILGPDSAPDNIELGDGRKEDKENKARASLVFNNTGAIPANLFYSSTNTESKKPAPLSILKTSTKPNVAPKIRITARHSFDRRSNSSKRKEVNRGVFHKIRKVKPKKKITKTQLYHAAMKIVHENKPKINTIKNDPDALQRKEQFERLRKILRKATKASDKPVPSNENINDADNESDFEDDNVHEGKMNSLTIENKNAADEPQRQGKFFKSKSETKAKYQVFQNLSVNIDHGKIQIDQNQAKPSNAKPKKRNRRSLFEEDYDAEVEEVHDEVVSLLKELERDVFPETPKKDSAQVEKIKPVKLDSPTTTKKISLLTSDIADWNVSDTLAPSQITPVPGISRLTPADLEPTQSHDNHTPKLFPLFYKKTQSFNNKIEPALKTDPPALKKAKTATTAWKGFGDSQLQIDAGQKEFGAIECKTCGFIYTQHVPEDEILHNEFHNSTHILNFKGWEKENVIMEVPEWGVRGRIITVSRLDSKPKQNKAQEVLRLADIELGFAEIPVGPQSFTYLACNHNQIIGVCVAQPQREAHKLISEFGIDFCSTETFDVKCGISRIWVNAKYRRNGVATKLIQAVRGHFVYGYRLDPDELAFSAPTDMGKMFAEKITGRKDFYVYQA